MNLLSWRKKTSHIQLIFRRSSHRQDEVGDIRSQKSSQIVWKCSIQCQRVLIKIAPTKDFHLSNRKAFCSGLLIVVIGTTHKPMFMNIYHMCLYASRLTNIHFTPQLIITTKINPTCIYFRLHKGKGGRKKCHKEEIPWKLGRTLTCKVCNL